MPAGRPAGIPKTGGRSRGTLNKATQIGRERLLEYGGEAIALHVAILRNELKCGACHGTGKTKFQAGGDKNGVRVCQSCWGSKKERIDPKTRQDSADSILDRVTPKLKAIEHSGSDDKPPIGIRVVLVKADGKH